MDSARATYEASGLAQRIYSRTEASAVSRSDRDVSGIWGLSRMEGDVYRWPELATNNLSLGISQN